MSYDIYTGILKMMDEFQDMNSNINFQYNYDIASSKRLKIKYHIDEISGTSSTLSKAMNLLDWLSSHIYHVGNYDGHIANNALELLAYSYDNGLECGINCRSLSITLSECCLAIGLKARAVFLMPLSPYDDDNHVVCEVFIPESNKWIMLDPTYNGYIMDENNNIFNVLELRHALANRVKLKFCDKFNYNGDYNVDFKDIETYYAKNLFYLKCNEIHTYNSEQLDDNKIIVFAPIGYDVKKSMLTNIDYRTDKWGDSEWLQKRRLLIKKDNLIYCSENKLKKTPF
jgi:hypothetical protein